MASEKKFKCGLYINSIQPLHYGHIYVIKTMIEQCEEPVVCVENDPRSAIPWSLSDRIEMLQRLFRDDIILRSIPIPALRFNDNWRTKLLKVTDIFRRIQPSDPEVLFSLTKEQSFCYINFMQVVDCFHETTDEKVRTAIKQNQPIDDMVPESIHTVVYRNLDVNKL